MLKRYVIIPLLLCFTCACKQKVTNLQVNNNIVASTVKETKVDATRLIIPGKSIGQTAIEEDMDSVFNRLGRSDYTDAAMGTAFNTWYAKHDTTGYQTDVYSQRYNNNPNDNASRVKVIRVTSPLFMTAEHIGSGAALNEVKKHYRLKPWGNYSSKNDTLWVYDDVTAGIAVEVNKQNKCVSVSIHKAGDNTGTYLSMHQNMQFNRAK